MELKIPPLVLVAIAAVLMWFAAYVPLLEVTLPARLPIALLLAIAGIGLCAAGVITFQAASTTVDPRTPEKTSALVSAGIYRVTRNPMYVGFVLVLLGWAYWLANLLVFAVIVAFILYMNRFQVAPEEKALQDRFGDDYRRYCRQVRRWI